MFFGKYSCKKCMINPINNYNMNNVLEKDIYLDSSALGQATGMKFSDSDRVSGMKFSDSDKASGLKKSVPNVVFGMKISAAYGAGGLKSSAASKHSGFPLFSDCLCFGLSFLCLSLPVSAENNLLLGMRVIRSD